MACRADLMRLLWRAEASTAAAISRLAASDSCGSCADTPAAAPATTAAVAAACCCCKAPPSLPAILAISTCDVNTGHVVKKHSRKKPEVWAGRQTGLFGCG